MDKTRHGEAELGAGGLGRPESQMQLWDVTESGSRFKQWQSYHSQNPTVFDLFRKFANDAANSGRTRLGARMIGERIRWYTSVETVGSVFKINDHHWPYYARLLAAIDSKFSEFFSFKNERFDATSEEIILAHTEASTSRSDCEARHGPARQGGARQGSAGLGGARQGKAGFYASDTVSK